MKMSTLTFDQTFIAAVGISAVLLVLSAAWIVRVLIQIEKSKVVALSSVLEDDGTGGSDLQFEESNPDSGAKHLEVEPADGSPSGGAIEMSPTGSSRKNKKEESPSKPQTSSTAKPMTARKARQKQRRITWTFLNIQILSVLTLILLTYLLLVQSNAAIFWRMLGSLAVFGVFLRFQIGEEIRRQRVDRIMLLLSLFLLIASMLSALVYSMKTLSQGEIYEGPARIVGYSMEQYNNTKHDPTTRTDIAVSWGKDWGCPLSGGKICQANVEGAMCQSHPDKEQTKHKPNYGNRRTRQRFLEEEMDAVYEEEEEMDDVYEEEEELEEDLEDEEDYNDEMEEDLEDAEDANSDLEQENEELTAENEMLQEEIDELKDENEVEDEENEELVDQENSEINEIADEDNEDLAIIEEEEYEDAQSFVDYEYEEEEEKLEDEIEEATDDEQKEGFTEELDEEKEDQEELDEEYEEDEQYLEDEATEYGDAADQEYSDFEEEQDETFDLEDEKDELADEVEATEEEIDENEGNSEAYDEEEEEIEEEYEEEEDYEDDDWYWDEYPSNYDDDYYEEEYWSYDWDSVWGDYACEDLFDADISGQTFDATTPAGGDDEWPFVNIYGSCKTCEAYILDYFAEEAFEQTQEYKQQAIVYWAGAMAGFIWTFLSYIKYRVLPTAENEIELLGSDGGVMA